MPNYPYTFQLPPLNVQDIPNDGVAGEFLGINGSGVLDWLTAGGTGDMLKADNLSGLASYPTARTNLGLGTGDSPTFANLTLTSPSLVSSAPVTISQTWNNAAVAFTGLNVNAAGTSDANSASGSLLADFQVGGVSKFTVRKDGAIVLPFNYAGIVDGSNNSGGTNYTWGGPRFGPAAFIAWTAGAPTSTADTILLRDAANTLALRNGANAQTFNVYGTYTSGTSYERLTLSAPSAANAIIGTNKGSGGGTARGLELQTDGVTRMTIDSVGAASFGTNSVSCQNVILPAGGLLVWAGTGRITNPSTGVFQLLDGAQTSFNRLQFGGTTDAFPAIARDGAGIKFTGAAAGSTAWIKVPPVAVGSLPVAATAGAGARAFVNDASAPVFGTAVAGGGAVLVPVYCTGSAWNVG